MSEYCGSGRQIQQVLVAVLRNFNYLLTCCLSLVCLSGRNLRQRREDSQYIYPRGYVCVARELPIMQTNDNVVWMRIAILSSNI